MHLSRELEKFFISLGTVVFHIPDINDPHTFVCFIVSVFRFFWVEDLVLVLEQEFGILNGSHLRILMAKSEFVFLPSCQVHYCGVLVIDWCFGENFSFIVIVRFKFINLCYNQKWDSILINSRICRFILPEIYET